MSMVSIKCHVYVPSVTPDMSTHLPVPPYQLHPLIPSITAGHVSCAQALGMLNTHPVVLLTHVIQVPKCTSDAPTAS